MGDTVCFSTTTCSGTLDQYQGDTSVVVGVIMALIPWKGKTSCTLIWFFLYSWLASVGHTEFCCNVRDVTIWGNSSLSFLFTRQLHIGDMLWVKQELKLAKWRFISTGYSTTSSFCLTDVGCATDCHCRMFVYWSAKCGTATHSSVRVLQFVDVNWPPLPAERLDGWRWYPLTCVWFTTVTTHTISNSHL